LLGNCWGIAGKLDFSQKGGHTDFNAVGFPILSILFILLYCQNLSRISELFIFAVTFQYRMGCCNSITYKLHEVVFLAVFFITVNMAVSVVYF